MCRSEWHWLSGPGPVAMILSLRDILISSIDVWFPSVLSEALIVAEDPPRLRRRESAGIGRRRDHVLVRMALRDQLRVLEHVERDVECRTGDLDVRRPAAELLIGGDRRREHGALDPRE